MPATGYDNRKNMGLQDPAVLAFKLSDLEESHSFTLNLGLFSCCYKDQMRTKRLQI